MENDTNKPSDTAQNGDAIGVPPSSVCYAPDVIEWTFGQEVFLRCDSDQKKGLVTGIVMRPAGVGYNVTWGDRSETFHYVFELTTSKNFSA